VSEDLLQKIYESGIQRPTIELVEPKTFALTDLGLAERLVAEYGQDLRYVPGQGWHAWTGVRWRRDNNGEVMRRMKLTVRGIANEAAQTEEVDARKKLLEFARRSESEARQRAAVTLATFDAELVAEPEALDANDFLLNVANGTLDLRTGELRDHDRGDLITKVAPINFAPGAHDPLWDSFLERVTGGDPEFAEFLARAVGYSLTGDTGEEVLFFAHGPTATGKSSFLEATKAVLGDYAKTSDFETFLARRGGGGIRNDIARLAGSRFVVSVEVEEGKRFAEGLVKMITGGDSISARYLYREAFEFRPRFKLWLAANVRPKVSAADGAMWRRVRELPFVNVIPEAEQDPDVKRRLRADPDVHAAVLAWAVQGCLRWQAEGLGTPAAVVAATADYRGQMDVLGAFIVDCCVVHENAKTSAAALYAVYTEWLDGSGERNGMTKIDFGRQLGARGYAPGKLAGDRAWLGIGLAGEDRRWGDRGEAA
jgi:putative DNA primase/helicase